MGLTRPEKWARDAEDRRKELEYRELMRKRLIEREREITTMAMLLDAQWTGAYFHKYIADPVTHTVGAKRWSIEGYEITDEQAEVLRREQRLREGTY